MAPKALAPNLNSEGAPRLRVRLAAAADSERPWEGSESESRVPGGRPTGPVAGSPCRRAAEAAVHSPFQPEGEKLFGEGDGARRKRQAV